MQAIPTVRFGQGTQLVLKGRPAHLICLRLHVAGVESHNVLVLNDRLHLSRVPLQVTQDLPSGCAKCADESKPLHVGHALGQRRSKPVANGAAGDAEAAPETSPRIWPNPLQSIDDTV